MMMMPMGGDEAGGGAEEAESNIMDGVRRSKRSTDSVVSEVRTWN